MHARAGKLPARWLLLVLLLPWLCVTDLADDGAFVLGQQRPTHFKITVFFAEMPVQNLVV